MGSTSPLQDKDRIFTNVYGFQEPWLKAAQARGDWDGTKKLMAIGQDAIIDVIKRSGLRGRGGAGFPTGMHRCSEELVRGVHFQEAAE